MKRKYLRATAVQKQWLISTRMDTSPATVMLLTAPVCQRLQWYSWDLWSLWSHTPDQQAVD